MEHAREKNGKTDIKEKKIYPKWMERKLLWAIAQSKLFRRFFALSLVFGYFTLICSLL